MMATILQIYVQPGANKDEVIGKHGDRLKIKLKAPAVDNQANESLIQFLAKKYRLSRKQVRIIRGQKSRYKTIELN